ncbi:hypothetical protein ACFC26_07870 [Kitasatospora purpeofusca]|uniref:hypothetical protein n=1 Tax=Kitasatospora purpeofusca TaxID=67352 RepID=UPI0035D8100C
MKPANGIRRFRETRYVHQRSEGTATRRTNGATKQLIRQRPPEDADFLAWLVGVDVAEVGSYAEVGDWPSHWIPRAQATLRRLGVTCQADARAAWERGVR